MKNIDFENTYLSRIEKSITSDQLKQIELSILKTFADFCKKNKLTYFLVAGTLIGALRYQDFIPWDDDIDVVMPRPEYEKFITLAGEYLDHYKVRHYKYTPQLQLHDKPFLRIVDEQYLAHLSSGIRFLPPWIDVLPIDGLPDNEMEYRKFMSQALKLRRDIGRCRFEVLTDPLNLSSQGLIIGIKNKIKKLAFLPYKWIGSQYFLKKLDRLAQTYDYKSASWVGFIVGGYGISERYPKNTFQSAVQVYFSNGWYDAPEAYEKYLSQLHGNYLRAPSLQQQKTHVLQAWRLK